jgi:hypothetical protein
MSCETPLFSHDAEHPELSVLAALRRLADDDIVLMRVALAADGGLLPTQFSHRDDFGLRPGAQNSAGDRIV